MKIFSFIISSIFLFSAYNIKAQTDSVKAQAKQAAESARLKMGQGNVRMAIQNIDVTRFPEVKLIVEAVKAVKAVEATEAVEAVKDVRKVVGVVALLKAGLKWARNYKRG